MKKLTNQEQKVLKLLIEGLSNKEIAEKLVISIHTVKTHIEHIYRKLAVSSRVQAARIAYLKQGK